MLTKKIGLLLSDENDWPDAFEALARKFNPTLRYRRKKYQVEVERIRIHPFNLRAQSSYDLVIDRLAWWYFQPREWLKKAALLDDVYLLNNPFTFQSMEKHSAYCAMHRLGMNIPETWLIPPHDGPDTEKYRTTVARYQDDFDLGALAGQLGFPLYMKPFDGGGWRGVSHIQDPDTLYHAYRESGQTVMHLQKGLDDYDVFVRSLAIGPQLITLKYEPARPMHARYVIDHGFLTAEKGKEAQIITKTINSFFHWDFNSCEAILKDGELWLIDFANACPDIAITSLHYYFPWAIKALYAWSVFCAVTERPPQITMNIAPYFKAGDSGLSYGEKLNAYEKLADKHFQTERFIEFRATQLKGLDETMWELVQSPEFDKILTNTVRSTFPHHEHDQFIAHFRGLLSFWVQAESPD
jgi:hypothetical protein